MKITFWSDYACPFCWIGEARLLKAIKELGMKKEITLIPRAFELDPGAPEKAKVNGLATIAGRYNMPLEQAAAQFEQIANLGREVGLTLNQIDTHHTNTFNAHRLMKLALASKDKAIAEKLNEFLFAAFFVENLNLADRNVLLETGMKAGLKEDEIRDVLESDQYAADVRADEYEAAKRGIQGVPYFLFEDGAIAPGAVSIEEFRSLLKNAIKEPKIARTHQCGAEGCSLE